MSMSKNEFEFRPLHLADALAKAAGFEVTYAYDDLVFIAHSEILIQFSSEQNDELLLFTHVDLAPDERRQHIQKLLAVAAEQSVKLTLSGRFSLKQKQESEEIDLQFFPEHEAVTA